jgi:hypothetical protein
MHKHARPKQSALFSGTPTRFFERELAGEDAPSLESMRTLYDHASRVHKRLPWNDLLEENLIVFEEPSLQQQCYCSVMGSLGEMRMIQAYIGPSSYFWFRKVHEGQPVTIADFYAYQHSIFVQFIPIREVDGPDRELLQAMHHPLAKGTVAPVFRTIRPGYYPWFVTENESRILATALECVLSVCDLMDKDPELDLWDLPEIYPLVTLGEAVDRRRKYVVGEVKAPVRSLTMPDPVTPDARRVQAIIDRNLPHGVALEVDHFYTPGMIGEKHARKACVRVALVIEAKTALALAPELGSPDESTGAILQRVILGAIEASGAIPSKIYVRDREYKALLAPIARALGFEIAVKKSLPALDFARNEMQAMMDDADS